ncbi:hypothetical protein ABPG73_005058 [Tetrahymena malaccensis]
MDQSSGSGMSKYAEEQRRLQISQYQLRKQLQMLRNMRGEQTSCVSLYIPERKKLYEVVNYLQQEESGAASIKNTQNRKSVQSALSMLRERLKNFNLHKKYPKGMIFFCADSLDSKRLLIEIQEPPKAVQSFRYSCNTTFYLDDLENMLKDQPTYGFVVADGHGYLISTVCGSDVQILQTKEEDLPNKHNKGGQSSLRFSRLCEAARERLVKNIAEAMRRCYADENGTKTNLSGIVLCGMSEIKDRVQKELQQLCPCIEDKIIACYDVSYGGQAGLNQALQMSTELLKLDQLFQEMKLLSDFYSNFSLETNKVVFGGELTVRALEEGNVKKLILCQDSELQRVVVYNLKTQEETIQYLMPSQVKVLQDSISKSSDKEANSKKSQIQLYSQENFNEWIVENISQFSKDLEIIFVSDKTQQGVQFSKGFQGVGGYLKYSLDYSSLHAQEKENVLLDQEYCYDDEEEFI